MRDLKQRFREVDLVNAPHLEDRIREWVWTREPVVPFEPRAQLGRRVLVAVVAFGLFVGAGAFAWHAFHPATPTRSPVPTMPASGDGSVKYLPLLFVGTDWNLRNGEPVTEGNATVAWASNVPFDERDLVPTAPAIPPWTIAALPPDGIVVTAEATPWALDPTAGPFPPGSMDPFDLSTAQVRGPVAEEPPGDYAVYWLQPHDYVLIRVYFGSPDPSAELVGQAQATLDHLEVPPVCPVPEEGPLGAEASPTQGAPGDQVELTGPMPFQHEDGSFDTSGDTTIVAWWNAKPEDWVDLVSFSTGPLPSPAGQGPLLRLGEGGRNACSFAIPFEVPDVPPGDYSVVLLQEGGTGAEAGATLEASVTFRVTDS
jgi:hypothetical protein